MTAKSTSIMAVLLSITVISSAAPSSPQPISQDETTHSILQAHQEVEYVFSGAPNTASIVELRLRGGLFAISSSGMQRWALDLGSGGVVRYAVRSSADGKTSLTLSSLESGRDAAVDLTVLKTHLQPADLDQLHYAEAALISAETARRRWQNAPTASVALARYDQAIAIARKLDDIPLLRLSLTQKSRFLLFEKSRFEEARAILNEAIQLRRGEDTAQLALSYKTLASVEAYLGHYDQSINAGKEALALYIENHDRYWQGIVLGNLSDSYDRAGQLSEASSAAHEALTDALAVQDAAGVVYCLGQIADIDRREGHFDFALRAFREALSWSRRIAYAPLVQEEIEKAEGVFYAQLGLWDEAELQLRSSLRHAQGRENASTLEARGLLAEALTREGNIDEALREYTEAINLAEQLHLPREQAQLLLQSSSVLLKLSPGRAMANIDRASQIVANLNAPGLTANIEISRGNVYLSSKLRSDLLQARQAFQHAQETSIRIGDRSQEANALAGLARTQQRRGDLDAALASIEQALRIVENSRAGLRNSTVAANFFSQYRPWYELAIATTIQRSQLPSVGTASRERDVVLAFQYAERMRARSLLDMLTQSEDLPSPGIPAVLSQRIEANHHAIETKQALLSRSNADVPSIANAIKQLYQEQDILSAEARSATAPMLASDSSMGSIIEHLREKLLTSDSVYFSFAIGEQSSYRWMITPDAVKLQILPGRKQLKDALIPLRRELSVHPNILPGEDVRAYAKRASIIRAKLQNTLSAVGVMLLAGIPSGTRTIYLSAEEDLLSVPWSALRLPCEHRTCYALERYEISNEPSAAVATYLAEHPSQPQSTRVAVVANPSSGKVAIAGVQLSPLPGAIREANLIAHVTPVNQTQITQGVAATPTAIKDLMARPFSVLHFAAHTVLVPQHAELSGISLYAKSSNDGVLWLRDIRDAHLSAPLVVLSGCDTQVSHETVGEGLNTLSQAFFFAGAHSVVGTLWKIDDDASADLMQHFYRNLLVREMKPAAALRAAQLALRSKDPDPLLWAPFVVNGLSGALPPQRSMALSAGWQP